MTLEIITATNSATPTIYELIMRTSDQVQNSITQHQSALELLGNFFNNAAIGAFLGSFSAFIFGIIAYDYTKRRERYKTHHDAVVKAEDLANRHL